MSALACQHVFYRPEHNAKGEHGFEFKKFLKHKNEMYQQIDLKEWMRKMGQFVIYHFYSA